MNLIPAGQTFDGINSCQVNPLKNCLPRDVVALEELLAFDFVPDGPAAPSLVLVSAAEVAKKKQLIDSNRLVPM